MPSLRPLALILLAAPAAVTAQVTIDGRGIRAGGTTIDATGVHTHGTDITRSGVTAGRGQGIVINTNEQQRRIDCGGSTLTVNGNDNRFTVVNCRTVHVMGNDNVIDARFAAPGRLTVMGNDDHVTYTPAPHVAVSVNNMGADSTVTRR